MDATTIFLVKIGAGLTLVGLAYLAIKTLKNGPAVCRKIFRLVKPETL